MPQDRDAVLVRAALNGDESSFATLVRKYQDRAYGVAIGILSDFDLARDVVQESFLLAYTRLANLEDHDRFGGWLRGIVRHTSHRALRELRRVRALASQLEQELDGVEPNPSPVRMIENEEEHQIVYAALERLNQKNREAVSLYYIDGLSYEDISGFLGVSQATVQGRLQRARARLRKELEMVADTLKGKRLPADFSEEIRQMLGPASIRKKQVEDVARRLAEIGPDALDPLVAALQGSHAPVRQVAARALCHLGDERALAPILRVLYSDDGPALGTLYHHGVVLSIPGIKEELVNVAQSNGAAHQRYLAINALAYARDDEAVWVTLADIFRNPADDTFLRTQALHTLCSLKPSDAVDLLAEGLRDEGIRRKGGWVWWIALKEGLVLPIESCLSGFGRDVRASARATAGRLLKRHGEAGEEVLSDYMKNGTADERATAALALANEDDNEPFEVLVEELVSGYGEPKWVRWIMRTLVRCYASNLIAWGRSNATSLQDTPALAGAVARARIISGEGSGDDILRYGVPSARLLALRELAHREGANVLPELRKCLREGTPRKVAAEAFRQMCRLNDAALTTVQEMRHSDHWTERKAAYCLLRRWGRLTTDERNEALADSHLAVRDAVLESPDPPHRDRI